VAHTDSEALPSLTSSQSRRQFCVHACQALSLVTVGAVLEACGGSSGSPTAPSGLSAQALPVLNANVSGSTVSLTIDASSPLSAVGSAALVQSSAGSFLVAQVAQDSFTALTAICTHLTCFITGYASGVYVCPCHGSEFSTSGSVVRGPAVRPLQKYSTQFANGVLSIAI